MSEYLSLWRIVADTPDYAAAEPLVQSVAQLLARDLNPARKKLAQKIAAIILGVQDKLHNAALTHEMQPPADNALAEPLNDQQKQSFKAYLRKKFSDETALDIGSLKDWAMC